MQRYSQNAQAPAALAKLRGPVPRAHTRQIRKQHAFGGQVFEHVQRLAAQMDQHGHAGFLAHKTDRPVLPVHILASQTGDVALARAQMTAQLIMGFSLGVPFRRDNFLMLFQRDGAFVLEAHGWPLSFGDD